MLSSISELWFADFLACNYDKDYSSLIISGTPTPDEVVDCWIGLLSQFHAGIKSSEALKYVEMSAKIERLNGKIHNVRSLAVGLSMVNDLYLQLQDVDTELEHVAALLQTLNESLEDIAECLREWDYYYDFTPETIEKDLEKVKRQISSDEMHLAIARSEYDADQEEKAANAPVNEDPKQNYLDMLDEMSLFFKPVAWYQPEATKTSQFVLMYNKMREQSQRIANQQNHGE